MCITFLAYPPISNLVVHLSLCVVGFQLFIVYILFLLLSGRWLECRSVWRAQLAVELVFLAGANHTVATTS